MVSWAEIASQRVRNLVCINVGWGHFGSFWKFLVLAPIWNHFYFYSTFPNLKLFKVVMK